VPSVCVFDVNETLLDIEFIAPLFQRLFGDRKVLREWFGQLILYSDAITLSGSLHDVLHVGAGSAANVGLDPQRVDSTDGHRGIENAYAHNACAPGRPSRIEAIEGRRVPSGHTNELAARPADQPAE